MRKFIIFIFLIVTGSTGHTVEIPESVFVDIANQYKEAFNAIDYKKVQSLWSPQLLEKFGEGKTDKEKQKEYERQVQLVMQHLGKMIKVELVELDPPDGAFFNAHFERGTAELFFVLNEGKQATEISLRVIGHSGCSEEHSPNGENAADEN